MWNEFTDSLRSHYSHSPETVKVRSANKGYKANGISLKIENERKQFAIFFIIHLIIPTYLLPIHITTPSSGIFDLFLE